MTKYEGVYRRSLREIFTKYKETYNLKKLIKDCIWIGDLARYRWQYYYILNNVDEIFKEVLTNEYVVEEL